MSAPASARCSDCPTVAVLIEMRDGRKLCPACYVKSPSGQKLAKMLGDKFLSLNGVPVSKGPRPS